MKPGKKSPIVLFSLSVWLLIVVIGLSSLARYANKAGAFGEPPPQWPAYSAIPRRFGSPTLVMMVHPQCPCSRASIGELARLMVSLQGRVSANVVFVRPEGFAEDWEKTDLWTSAALIPGVTVSSDDDGSEARRFGSQTSGQVVVYGTNGRLLFSGGVTAARGHSGDNDGSNSIIARLTGNGLSVEQTPVFGCPLFKAERDVASQGSAGVNHGK